MIVVPLIKGVCVVDSKYELFENVTIMHLHQLMILIF